MCTRSRDNQSREVNDWLQGPGGTVFAVFGVIIAIGLLAAFFGIF